MAFTKDNEFENEKDQCSDELKGSNNRAPDGHDVFQHGMASLSKLGWGKKEELRLDVIEEIAEFSFEILEGSGDLQEALSIIMDNVGRQIHLDYVSLYWVDERTCQFKLEQFWKKTPLQKDLEPSYQCERKRVGGCLEELKKNGMHISYVQSVDDKTSLPWDDANEMVSIHCSVKDNGHFIGVLSFGDCHRRRKWTHKEIKAAKLMARVISAYIAGKRTKEEVERKVEMLSSRDALTGLLTPAKFKEKAEAYLRQWDGNTKLAVVSSDFMNFKYINDTYGYQVGNAILKEFAIFVSGDNPLVIGATRVYADIIISMVLVDDEKKLKKTVEEANEQFSQEQNQKYDGLNLKISTGAYILSKEEADIIQAIDKANISRKRMKELRRNGILFYEPYMLTEINHRQQVLADFQEGLDNHEFVLYIQPQTNTKTEETIGGEALVRWKKPDKDLIYPDQFIPVLEESGSIVKLDFYMLELVLKTLARWKREKKTLIPISINFSRVHLYDQDFSARVVNMVKEYDVNPLYVDIEITESVFVEEYEKVSENIKNLHNHGFRVAIDDFGTGYSSLNILTKVYADTIKIDKSFLNGAEESLVMQHIIESMISLAKELNLSTICEGVETKAQLDFLRKSECDIIQGYYYAKPMPLAEFERYVFES